MAERASWATWDVESQLWELAAVFDAGHCDNCDGATKIEAIEIADMEATVHP